MPLMLQLISLQLVIWAIKMKQEKRISTLPRFLETTTTESQHHNDDAMTELVRKHLGT